MANRKQRRQLCPLWIQCKKGEKGHANLLGGRAIRHELSGLVSTEIGSDFDLTRMLNHGYLPRHYINDMEIAIEAKATSRIRSDHLNGLCTLKEEHPNIKQRIIVCLEPKPRLTSDGILICPEHSFTRKLWAAEIF